MGIQMNDAVYFSVQCMKKYNLWMIQPVKYNEIKPME
jgi:hypothetical protein